MPISHSKKLIFIHVPKTAGCFFSIRMLLDSGIDIRKYHWPDVYWDIFYGPIQMQPYCLTLQHLTMTELKQKVTPELIRDYTSFSFIRNPYSRAYSDYKWHKDFRGDFTSFLTHIKNKQYPSIDYTHIRPQYQAICDNNGNIIVDTIIKVEEIGLHRDFFDTHGLDLSEFKIDKYNSDKVEYLDIYTPEQIRLVNELYHKDFEILGYKPKELDSDNKQ
jgi:hypothetical protein